MARRLSRFTFRLKDNNSDECKGMVLFAYTAKDAEMIRNEFNMHFDNATMLGFEKRIYCSLQEQARMEAKVGGSDRMLIAQLQCIKKYKRDHDFFMKLDI